MSMSAGTATDTPAVEISGLHKWFGEFHVLADINLAVGRSERIVICGPSGSGKSTLLRCINRLEDFQHGEIVVDGIVLTRDIRRVDAVRRERSEEHTSELQSHSDLVCRLLLEKKKKHT